MAGGLGVSDQLKDEIGVNDCLDSQTWVADSLAKPQWRKAQAHIRAQMTDREWKAMFRAFRAVTAAVGSVQLTTNG
jgi:hypothetical protein